MNLDTIFEIINNDDYPKEFRIKSVKTNVIP